MFIRYLLFGIYCIYSGNVSSSESDNSHMSTPNNLVTPISTVTITLTAEDITVRKAIEDFNSMQSKSAYQNLVALLSTSALFPLQKQTNAVTRSPTEEEDTNVKEDVIVKTDDPNEHIHNMTLTTHISSCITVCGIPANPYIRRVYYTFIGLLLLFITSMIWFFYGQLYAVLCDYIQFPSCKRCENTDLIVNIFNVGNLTYIGNNGTYQLFALKNP